MAHEQSRAEDEEELTNREAARPESELEPGAPEPEIPKTTPSHNMGQRSTAKLARSHTFHASSDFYTPRF